MLTEEQQLELIYLNQRALTIINDLNALLAKSAEQLRTNAALLDKATEDIHVLWAFIESKGLEPPRIQSKFIN
jgi:hypothetical protein